MMYDLYQPPLVWMPVLLNERCTEGLCDHVDRLMGKSWCGIYSPSKSMPWFSRRLNPKGGVEFLRRHGLAEDPEFMELYRDAKRGNLRQPVFLLIGLALIGVILLGVRYLGWTW